MEGECHLQEDGRGRLNQPGQVALLCELRKAGAVLLGLGSGLGLGFRLELGLGLRLGLGLGLG